MVLSDDYKIGQYSSFDNSGHNLDTAISQPDKHSNRHSILALNYIAIRAALYNHNIIIRNIRKGIQDIPSFALQKYQSIFEILFSVYLFLFLSCPRKRQ